MAFIQCDCFSETLGVSASMNVILPQKTDTQVGLNGAAGSGKHPVLYLLHGWSDDHSIWMRRTSLERYVAPLGIAVIMPAVNLSYYANEHHGARYWDYVRDEIPALAQQFFPISDRPEDTYVAGLSMGGYGSFKLALHHPERYAAAGCFSGPIRPHVDNEKRTADRKRIFGNIPTRDSELDIAWLFAQAKEKKLTLPRLYQSCGTRDFLYQDNVDLRETLDDLGVECTTDFRDGVHEWGFWDTDIRKFLKWLEQK